MVCASILYLTNGKCIYEYFFSQNFWKKKKYFKPNVKIREIWNYAKHQWQDYIINQFVSKGNETGKILLRTTEIIFSVDTSNNTQEVGCYYEN